MFKRIKKLFKKDKKVEKLTLNEMIDFINRKYYFNDFNEELVDEIYSLLLDYGNITVQKIDNKKYLISINEQLYLVSESGMQLQTIYEP